MTQPSRASHSTTTTPAPPSAAACTRGHGPDRRADSNVARSQARSDDPEADGPAQPLVAPAVHPFTGTFAASKHTVAFQSKAFRLVFPLHVVAMALLFCVAVSVVLKLGSVPGGPLTTFLLITIVLALGLGARIAVHRWNCQARAQRFGAIAWTIIVACGCCADFITYCLKKPACEIPSMYVYPLFSILFVVINASHGMEFWHTAFLAGLVLCDFIAVRTVCGSLIPVNLAIAALVATFGVGHFAQLQARHAFVLFEHIQTSRDRLEHDFQRLEYRLSGSSSARLPTVVTPTESSTCGWTTISAAPQQKFSSAPERVLIEWPPPHATHPSTAGSSSAGSSTAADYLSDSVPLYSVTSNLSESVPLYSVSRRQPSPLERPGDL